MNCCSKLSTIPSHVGNSKCMKPRCLICEVIDKRKKRTFLEQTLPFNQETTILNHIPLSIYSCVTNVTLEIKSVCRQTNYELDSIIIKGASETTAGDSGWLFISSNQTIRKKIEMCYSKRRLLNDGRHLNL